MGNLQCLLVQLEWSSCSVNISWVDICLILGKDLMWLVGLRKNMKSCHIKGSLNRSFQKNLKKMLIPIAPKNIHVERITGCNKNWSTKQWLANSKNWFTNINRETFMSFCQILNPNISRVVKTHNFSSLCLFPVHLKLLWKLWKYNLFEITISRFRILYWFLFFKFSSETDYKW